MALFCVATVGAQEPNPKQLFREAQQAQQSGNSELAIQKYQLRTRGPRLPLTPLGTAPGKNRSWNASLNKSQNKTKAKVISPVLPSP
jgi:hypothetical protein